MDLVPACMINSLRFRRWMRPMPMRKKCRWHSPMIRGKNHYRVVRLLDSSNALSFVHWNISNVDCKSNPKNPRNPPSRIPSPRHRTVRYQHQPRPYQNITMVQLMQYVKLLPNTGYIVSIKDGVRHYYEKFPPLDCIFVPMIT